MDWLIEWVKNLPAHLGLPVVGAAAAVEYLLPMMPGDSVLLAGALWILADRDPFWVVWAVATLGGVLGAWVQFEIGRWLRRPDGTWKGSWIRKVMQRDSVDRFFELYRKFGPGLLALNRALPGVRGVVFLAAGAGGLPRTSSLVLGGISQGLWSFGVLGLGVWVGGNWEEIEAVFLVYRRTVYAVAGALAIAYVIYKLWRARTQSASRSSSSS